MLIERPQRFEKVALVSWLGEEHPLTDYGLCFRATEILQREVKCRDSDSLRFI
jgi:hypothetical protein